MNKFVIIALLAITTFLSGCATPLGQQYGAAGALGGALIGAATGGGRGAVIGGATGALLGGAIGDQQTYQGGQPRGYYGGPAPYYGDQPQCYIARVPVRDYAGYVVGYQRQRVCR